MYLANASQIRQADRTMIDQLGFSGLLLMETAGRKSAEYILAHHAEYDRVVILAGPGNNGGDGLVIARYLALAGKQVDIWLAQSGERFTGDAAVNYQALKGAPVNMLEWSGEIPPPGALLVDALLGTGIASELRGVVGEMIFALQVHPGPVVAIDLPSGLDADTGYALNTPLTAAVTLTFQCPKICHFTTPAANFCGEVVVADIGIWDPVMAGLGIQRKVLTGELCRSWQTQRPADGHKGTFGHALLIGGSDRFAGAIALSGHAALHVGAGLASVFGTAAVRSAVLALGPEVMVEATSTAQLDRGDLNVLREMLPSKAIGIGPGMGQAPETAGFFRELLGTLTGPVVLDADALNLLAAVPELWGWVPAGSILTPHPGEMRRLSGRKDIPDRRLESAEALARERNCVIVLKGQGTVVAHPDGRTYVNPTGNPGMATGGSGDVLTGAIVGLLAQGYAPLEAAALGVFVHGQAGDRAAIEFGEPGVTAGRVLQALGPALRDISSLNAPNIQRI